MRGWRDVRPLSGLLCDPGLNNLAKTNRDD
jgi:hypothetical protein